MNFLQAIATCFRKYGVFRGRAARPEYWYWVLFVLLGSIVTGILDAMFFPRSGPVIDRIFSLAILVPYLAVEVRRLHDVNRSGWWILMSFTIIGIIYPLLVWKCRKGTEGDNRFGPDTQGLERVVDVFT